MNLSIDMEDNEPKPTPPKKAKYLHKGDGEKRAYLRVFETPPAQMLNAYGQSSFVKKTDAEVWEGLVEPFADWGYVWHRVGFLERRAQGRGA